MSRYSDEREPEREPAEPTQRSEPEIVVRRLPEPGRTAERDQEHSQRRTQDREHEPVGRYRLSRDETETLRDVGRFRVVRTEDLQRFRYEGNASAMRQDLRSLQAQGLLKQTPFLDRGRKSSIAVLTKEGRRLLRKDSGIAADQAIYAGLVKPREAPHDAAIYRMYQAEAAAIRARGGTILFADVLKLPRTVLPAKFYSSKSGANKTVRYFVGRNPIFLSPAAEGGAPVVSFAYIDASNETTAGFRTYLAQYRGLLGALDKFRLIYVAKEAERFEQAGKEFARILAPEESVERLRSVDPNRLIDHFLARMCHERRDYQGFDTAKIQRLAMELKEFKGPAFDSLFEIFRSQGSAPILAELSRFKSAKAQPEGTFETQFLPYSYAFLGAV